MRAAPGKSTPGTGPRNPCSREGSTCAGPIRAAYPAAAEQSAFLRRPSHPYPSELMSITAEIRTPQGRLPLSRRRTTVKGSGQNS